MPCTKCSSDFTLFNWKIKCGECENKYCNKCLKRKEGVLFCEVCLVLIKRPPDRVKLMELKVKDLRTYLNKNDISTYGLVEKNELVDLFCNKYIPEKQHKGVDKLTANFGDPLKPINGFFNNLESVITESRPGARPSTVYATAPPTRVPENQSVPDSPQQSAGASASSAPTGGSTHSAPRVVPEERPTTSQFTEQFTDFTPDSSPLPQRYPRLDDFKSVEELSELSPKLLKILLRINRVEYRGCIEKGELLERAEALWLDNNKNKDLPDDVPIDEICKLCMDAPLDCVLLECGHIATCIECGKKLAECPICRKYVVRVVRTFKA
ncbi:E3 ubiquitin-protein ligase RNF34 [Anthonomus grandis grandis]|uniref:E3 ubiquitin-protein ligase RNF34 n=1 Tax=Anthonomus grandis grandis TaxID=2921223 RepID=UPI00216606F4|nr:E3 ubiquitin-protein ligase RNF34 [Anthonomus grandis grandis]